MKLREERQKAYTSLARITKNMGVPDPSDTSDLAEVHSEIEMLTEDAEVLDAATSLIYEAAKARRITAEKNALAKTSTSLPADIWSSFKEAKSNLDPCRTDFINVARKELGLKPSPPLNREGAEPKNNQPSQ
jgi:hypothetical protein